MTQEFSRGDFLGYAEDRAALRPTLVIFGVGLPVIVVVCAVAGGITGQTGLIVPAAIALIVWVFSNSMRVFVHWPTGIRIDEAGVRIGNVHRPTPNRRRRPPAPSFQAYQVFSASWSGVLAMRVSTDRHELRQLSRQSRRASTKGTTARGGMAIGFYLGMLTPPFMRAALIIEVDPGHATFPEFRIQQAVAVASSQVGTQSRTWVAPTRHPQQLAEVVTTITHSSQWNARRMG
jgi:hypothetical protein